ncbi:MAG: ASCH domain-containing protein [Patescibacteria group bacterium]|jgi:ASC-1-like (ASCH) protein
MSIISLDVQEPYLSFILNGQKTVEGRLNKGKFKELKVGDKLSIGPDEKLFIVDQINNYDGFRNMIIGEGLKNVIPDKNTLEEAEAVYYKFYTKEQEKEFGVIAIRIKML